MPELPMDPEAERAVLGAVMREPHSFGRLMSVVSRGDFAVEKNRRIWTAMESQWNAGGTIDAVTIASHLRDAGTIDSVGWDYLLHLDDGLGAIFGGDDYARRVKDKAILRRTIVACQSLIAECQQDGDSRDVLDRGERVLRDLSAETQRDRRLMDAAEIIQESGGLDRFIAGTQASVPLPWFRANDILAGGFRNGELIVIAAATSVGKTATASQIAACAAERGIGTALFSLEMKRREMLMRMAVMRSGVDGNCVRMNRMSREQRAVYTNALLAYTQMPVYFDDEAGSSVPALHAAIRHKRATHSVGLVIVDYLQLVEGASKASTREQEVSSVSRGLKLMAQHFDLPVVALSQINREGEGRAEPEIRDLRESGSIGNDANTIMFLHRRDQNAALYSDTVPVRLLIKKQRNGPLGYVDLLYHKRHLRFREEQAEEEAA